MPRAKAVVVREFRPSDDEGVRAVARELHATLRRVYRRRTAPDAASGRPYTRLVALVAGAVVGTATYELRDDHVFFGSLGVLTTSRQRGVARELVWFIERAAAARDMGAVQCETIEETGNALVFERLGFVVATRRASVDFEGADGQPVHELVMVKRLHA